MNSRAPNEKIVLPAPARPEQLLNFGRSKRLPVIVQTEVAECGLACLGMIAGYHGFDTDMLSLRQQFSISSHGVGLKDIMDMATRLHFAPRAVKAEMDELKHLRLPCILHWNLKHFVVLKSIGKNKYVLHDPACGERVINTKTFSNEFTGVALELTPTQDFTPGEAKQTLQLSHFWSRITGLKRSLIQVISLSLLLQLFAVVAPFYMQTVVDDVLLRQDLNLLMVLSIGFGLLAIIQTATSALRSHVVLYLSNNLGMQMSANLFRHLIRLPMDYFAKRHMGDVVSRFGALGQVRSLLTDGLIAAVVDGVMAFITLVAMFFYSATLAFIVLVVAAAYAALRWATYRPFRLITEESIIASAKENSHFMESVRAIQTIKIFQRETDRQFQWQNRLAAVMNKNIQLARWGIGFDIINGLLFGLGNIVVIYSAATAAIGNLISLGMLYAFMAYQGRFIEAMDSLISQWVKFKMLGIYLNRLADIAFTKPENNYTNNANTACTEAGSHLILPPSEHTIKGKIEVKNLAYRYGESEDYIFKNLNFIIYPGETVAITGPSGCGKTTLLKCLMGLIEPSEGDIFIDDKQLSRLPHYRSQIAAVMQDDQLLSGDIAENIACFAPEIDRQRVYECARQACIFDEINKMPMGFNTLVGDMGTSLSGGQKQRVILARALYRAPRLLFMDEATSHLDITNESLVNTHIQALDITRVLVAHRPETVGSAGRQINIGEATAS